MLDKYNEIYNLLETLVQLKTQDIQKKQGVNKYLSTQASNKREPLTELVEYKPSTILFNKNNYEATPKFYHSIDTDEYFVQSMPTGSMKITQYRQIPASTTVIVENVSLLNLIGITNPDQYFMIENIAVYPYLNAVGCTLGADYDAYVEFSKNGQLLYHLRGISSEFNDYNIVCYNSMFGVNDIEKFTETNNETEPFHYFIIRDLVSYTKIERQQFKKFMERAI